MCLDLVLEGKLRVLFPDSKQRQLAIDALSRYGADTYEPEVTRVRLAILKLAGANMDYLRHYVEAAKTDYRDVLAGAEYPAQMGYRFSRLPATEQEQLIRQDREQYERWLREVHAE